MDWDNLRYFLELARAGTLAAAARRLAVEHTTVSRRIQALEKQMGAALFAREAGGHRLTEAGRQLLPVVEAMESAVMGAERAAPASHEGPSGLVRVGATEGFGTLILAPHLAQLTRKHPHLSIDLLALPRMLHLSRREADIVISLERPTRGSVIVSRLSDYSLYLYGQREYLARQPERFAFRSTSITAQYEAVRAGAGLAVLPAFLADRDPVLTRVLPQEGQFTRTFWMSMPSESKHLARMQVTWAFLRETVAAQQELLKPKAVR